MEKKKQNKIQMEKKKQNKIQMEKKTRQKNTDGSSRRREK